MIGWLLLGGCGWYVDDFGVGGTARRTSPDLVEVEFSPGKPLGDDDWGVSRIRWFRVWSDGVEVGSDRIKIEEGGGPYEILVQISEIPPEQDELEFSGVLYWTEGPFPRGATSTVPSRLTIR